MNFKIGKYQAGHCETFPAGTRVFSSLLHRTMGIKSTLGQICWPCWPIATTKTFNYTRSRKITNELLENFRRVQKFSCCCSATRGVPWSPLCPPEWSNLKFMQTECVWGVVGKLMWQENVSERCSSFRIHLKLMAGLESSPCPHDRAVRYEDQNYF